MTAKLTATLAMAAILVAAAFGQEDHRRNENSNRDTHSQARNNNRSSERNRNSNNNRSSEHTRTWSNNRSNEGARNWNNNRSNEPTHNWNDRSTQSNRNWNNNRSNEPTHNWNDRTIQGNRNWNNNRPNEGSRNWNNNRSNGPTHNWNDRTIERNRNWNNDRGRSEDRVFGGEHFRPMDWRRDHPGWNGHLYYRSGRYFFDPGFTIVADIDNEWSAIATIAGGVAVLGALDDDPYLVFAGEFGELYAVSEYDTDLYCNDPVLRLRAEYFSRPYFWRDGIRFDRHVVEERGRRFYQFRRH